MTTEIVRWSRRRPLPALCFSWRDYSGLLLRGDDDVEDGIVRLSHLGASMFELAKQRVSLAN